MTIHDFIDNKYSLRHDMPKSTEVPAIKAEKKKKKKANSKKRSKQNYSRQKGSRQKGSNQPTFCTS